MTDYQTLPPSVPSVIDLDARIAAAFADGAKSNDVATLIKDTEHATASASDLAAQARNHAAFKRERLQAALGKLRERLAQLKDQEENARRQVVYDKAEAVRDELAKELADVYPGFAQKLADLLVRIAANDREIEYINGHALPSGAKRLLVAELVARGLAGFVHNSVATPRLLEELCLPAFECSPHDRYAWPRSR
jgi:ElaB/YqjD/DUF883 family membrane-anchored ribosome-binding protein